MSSPQQICSETKIANMSVRHQTCTENKKYKLGTSLRNPVRVEAIHDFSYISVLAWIASSYFLVVCPLGKLASPLQAVFSSGFAVPSAFALRKWPSASFPQENHKYWLRHSAIGRAQRENRSKTAFARRKCQSTAKALDSSQSLFTLVSLHVY